MGLMGGQGETSSAAKAASIWEHAWKAADSLDQMIWKQGHTSSSPAKICTISIKDRVQWSKKKKLRFFRLIDPVGEVFFFQNFGSPASTCILVAVEATWVKRLERLLKWTASTKRTSDPTSVQCRNKQSDKFMLQSNQRQPKATNIWSTSFET